MNQHTRKSRPNKAGKSCGPLSIGSSIPLGPSIMAVCLDFSRTVPRITLTGGSAMKRIALAAVVALLSVPFGSARADQPQQPAPSGTADLIKHSNSLDSLTAASRIPLDGGRSLTLEPGIRATRTDSGYLFSTYTGKQIELESGTSHLSLPSPTLVQLTPEGWLLDGRALDAHSLTARRAQDDADNNLKSMQEAAKKLKSKQEPPANTPQANKKLRFRWLFQEDPMPTAELFNTAAIQQLSHLSNVGF
jgi:hypothetical protein